MDRSSAGIGDGCAAEQAARKSVDFASVGLATAGTRYEDAPSVSCFEDFRCFDEGLDLPAAGGNTFPSIVVRAFARCVSARSAARLRKAASAADEAGPTVNIKTASPGKTRRSTMFSPTSIDAPLYPAWRSASIAICLDSDAAAGSLRACVRLAGRRLVIGQSQARQDRRPWLRRARGRPSRSA